MYMCLLTLVGLHFLRAPFLQYPAHIYSVHCVKEILEVKFEMLANYHDGLTNTQFNFGVITYLYDEHNNHLYM